MYMLLYSGLLHLRLDLEHYRNFHFSEFQTFMSGSFISTALAGDNDDNQAQAIKGRTKFNL